MELEDLDLKTVGLIVLIVIIAGIFVISATYDKSTLSRIDTPAGQFELETSIRYMDGTVTEPMSIISMNALSIYDLATEKAVKDITVNFYFTPKINDGTYVGEITAELSLVPTLAIQTHKKIADIPYDLTAKQFTLVNGQKILIESLTIPIDKSLGIDSVEAIAESAGIVKNTNLSLLFSGTLLVTTEAGMTYPISFKDLRVNAELFYTPYEDWTVDNISGDISIGRSGGTIDDSTGSGGVESGTLVITTSPVIAKIYVDGLQAGVGGVAIAKPVGQYTITFEQYVYSHGPYRGFPYTKWEAPPPITVTLSKGETKTIEAHYTVASVNVDETGYYYEGQPTSTDYDLQLDWRYTDYGDTGITYEQGYGNVEFSGYVKINSILAGEEFRFYAVNLYSHLFIRMPDNTIIVEKFSHPTSIAETTTPGTYGGVIHQGWSMPLQGTYTAWTQDGNEVSNKVTFTNRR